MNSQVRVAQMRALLEGKYPHPDSRDSWMYLVTEVAEVGDVLLRMKNPGDKRTNRNVFASLEEQLAEELGHVQMMLCTLASHYGVDLENECSLACEVKERTYG